jgi:hypothetical protein
MIHFTKGYGENTDTVTVERIDSNHRYVDMALAGQIASGVTKFTVHVKDAVVAVEFEPGGKLISILANDVDHWQVEGSVIRQVKVGRGREGIDYCEAFMGSWGRPDCAKILVPWSNQPPVSARILLDGNSRLVIDRWNPENLVVVARQSAKVYLGDLHVNGHLRLECVSPASINGEWVSCRSFKCGAASGIKLRQFLVTDGQRDSLGTPMEWRFDLPVESRI